MDVTITPAPLAGRMEAPPSKSAAHRAVICAALAPGESRLSGVAFSRDILATLSAVQALGARAAADEAAGEVVIWGIAPGGPTPAGPVEIDCGESGSTLRFLLPVAAALGVPACFVGHGRLPSRPLGPLAEQMAAHGVAFSATAGMPFEISGRLTPGRYALAGNVSSQFITGLLFALPLLGGDSEIVLTTPLESAGYVDLTLEALKNSGIIIGRDGASFRVRGGQRCAPRKARLEADYSNAAFWLTAGALGGREICCTGLTPASAQGDRAILPLLRRFGASVEEEAGAVRVRGGALRGIEIDASPIPDLVPILCVAAAAARGETTIYNAGRLRLKECDRLRAMEDCLTRLGTRVRAGADTMVISGGVPLAGGTVDGYNDHRVVMAMAIAAGLCGGPLTIRGAQAVEKSYPDFFTKFQALGGVIDVF